MIDRGIDGKTRRARLELDRRISRPGVEPAIFERNIRGALKPAGADTAARALFAADLEQIGEVIVEQQRQVETRIALTVILHADSLISGSAPQEDRAHDMQHVLLQHDAAVVVNIGIGEIDGQRGIVVAHIRAKQQRLNIVQHQLQPGEIAGVGVEQAVRAAGGSADVAVAVEYDEGVVMLERAPRPGRGPGHRNVERRLRDDLGFADRGDLGDGFNCH